jgi:catechol 2,3-dioxygenase-like lactoylglutathione lyase family enzyme
MSSTTATLRTTKLGRVCISVADPDRALDFYTGTLGLEKVVDVPMGPNSDMRWIEVRFPGAETTIALGPPPPGVEPGGQQTGICLDTTDVEGDHAALKAAGADVDAEVSRMGGVVPPMFWMRDPDGNALIVVQAP